jgi:MFS family permease
MAHHCDGCGCNIRGPVCAKKLALSFFVNRHLGQDIFWYGITVPVLPFALMTRASVPPQDVQRWVSILLAVFSAGQLVSASLLGWYADRSSTRRLPFLAGRAMLTGATALLCIGTSVGTLLASRFLHRFSAAVL